MRFFRSHKSTSQNVIRPVLWFLPYNELGYIDQKTNSPSRHKTEQLVVVSKLDDRDRPYDFANVSMTPTNKGVNLFAGKR